LTVVFPLFFATSSLRAFGHAASSATKTIEKMPRQYDIANHAYSFLGCEISLTENEKAAAPLSEGSESDGAKARPKLKRKLKKPRAKLSLLFLVFWLAIIGLSFALVVDRAGRYNELRAERDVIETAIELEAERYYDLIRQRDFFDTYAYIERLARERLGMMRPNELMFRNIAE